MNHLELINKIATVLVSRMNSDERPSMPIQSYDSSWRGKSTMQATIELRFYDMDNDGNNNPRLFKKYNKDANKLIKPFELELKSMGITYQIAWSEKGWFPILFEWQK